MLEALPPDSSVLCVAMLMVARASDRRAVVKGMRILNEAELVDGL
jgi:hypothetical protein